MKKIEYYNLRCKCGKWRVGQTANVRKYVLRCRFCDAKTKVFSERKQLGGHVIQMEGPYDTPEEAARKCAYLNYKYGVIKK